MRRHTKLFAELDTAAGQKLLKIRREDAMCAGGARNAENCAGATLGTQAPYDFL